MASARAGSSQPVGSADWIHKEYNEVSALCENELEDFTFSARNETEWLNEHMSEIFSSNKLHLADILKTPGKLRGKTPRTARQRSPLKEIRQPLGEIASIDNRFNSPLPKKTTEFIKPKLHEAVPQLKLKHHDADTQSQHNHDSGYHGDSSDEIEVELPETQDLERDEIVYAAAVADENTQSETQPKDADTREERSTEGSYHSAEEAQTVRKTTELQEPEGEVERAEEQAADESEKASEQLRRESAEQHAREVDQDENIEIHAHDSDEEEEEVVDIKDKTEGIESQDSTVAKVPVRKSSLNFAPLPKREPLNTKKSMGNIRVSSQTSYIRRITSGKSIGAVKPVESDDEMEDEEQENRPPSENRADSEDALKALQSKTSAQRLHERITALGKTQSSRPTKSILVNNAGSQAFYPVLPDPESDASRPASAKEESSKSEQRQGSEEVTRVEEEEEAVLPAVTTQEDRQPQPHQQQQQQYQDEISAYSKDVSVEPDRTHEATMDARTSTTPSGSPPKPALDYQGSVNTSKSRLQTLMESARGLFTNSATASSQAKLEPYTSTNSPKREAAQPTYPTLHMQKAAEKNPHAPLDASKPFQRQELPVKAKTVEKVEVDEVPSLTPVEVGDATVHQDEEMTVPDVTESEAEEADEMVQRPQSAMEPPPRPRTALAKPGSSRRPLTKPVNTQPVQQKVSIKLGPTRRPQTGAMPSGAPKEQESAPRLLTSGKESMTSNSTAGSTGSSLNKTMTSKAKALLAAERKREAEEKAMQKKAAAKLELERKRAAQQEEMQRREQARQAAERQKERERQEAEEKKRRERQEAVEKKRAEAQAKREQLQKEHQQQNALKSSMYRPEPPRPVSRQAMVQDFPKPPTTISKQAPKRVWDPDNEDKLSKPSQVRQTNGLQKQQDGKRRKTNEQDEVEPPQTVRPVMPPPIRNSNIKNNLKKSVFGANNYPRAPPPAAHHQQSQLPPRPPTAMDNSRFQNGAIPFADSASHPAQQAPAVPNPFKTPMQPARFGQANGQMQQQHQQQQHHHHHHLQQQQQQQLMKSSPLNGENIHLEPINTDSEDDDSEDERDRKADRPSWVQTPNLNDALMDQDSIDPGLVFGPIPALNMEEMFKGKGQKRDFRNRTSSANWFNGDRLTEDEIRKDIEAREKMKRDGGWSFGL